MRNALEIRAGDLAWKHIREHGLAANDVSIAVGASGGPKWLVLHGLDRVVFGDFLARPRQEPLQLVGSSIGSWRMACLAQDDPVAALDRLQRAYIDDQQYSARPSPAEVSKVGSRLLDMLLGEHGSQEILANPQRRLHVITARSRGPAGSERRHMQLAALGLAAVGNMISRRSLRLLFERVIFDGAGDASPFRALDDFPTRHVGLTRENLRCALLASGAIPLVLEGVRIPGAPPGIYRDGGIIDYHPAFDFGSGAGIVLYPHFYSHIVPGWFDKSLTRRRARGPGLSRVLLLAPSPAFVAQLPGGRIPDRTDFHRMTPADRIKCWHAVSTESTRLGDEFGELMVTGRWEERIRPLEGK